MLAVCILGPQLESLRLCALEEQERLTAQAASLAAELEEARREAAAAEPLQAELEQVGGGLMKHGQVSCPLSAP